MKKYIVTETESNAPNYEYQEEFDTIEETKVRMLDLYYQVVTKGNFDAIEKAELYQNSAIVYLIDGSTVEWEITNKYYKI